MRRSLIVASCAAFVLAACTAGGGSSAPSGPVQTISSGGSHAPVTLTVWDYFTEREQSNFTQVLQQFHKVYPWIKVNLVPGKQFADYVRGINSNQPFDVAVDAGPDNVGKYCSTGAFLNLAPYLKASGIDTAKTFPPAALRYTNYGGVQCALPLLTDAYGLYYNKDMFAAAHIDGPPKTMSEFTADAKKLTVFNSDGTIKVAGFMPLSSFYENYNMYNGLPWNTTWYNKDGTAAFGTDPSWQTMMNWDKSLESYYGGYDNLQKFYAAAGGANSEWGPSQAFETGKVAMSYDGEWREAFIQNDKAKINYGTAPVPVADDESQIYGAGQVGGTIIGIPRTVQHPAEAWALVKFLSTNTKSLETMADLLKNVPTTYAALKDPVLSKDPKFVTFMNMFKNPNSHFYPLTTAGTSAADALGSLTDKWEAGQVPDLQKGLQQLDDQVNSQLQLAG